MRLVCTNCEYKFNTEKVPKICPYCGSSGTLEREKTADDFIKEAEYNERS